MQDVTPQRVGRHPPSDSSPAAAHLPGPVWIWALAALIVGLAAAIVFGLWLGRVVSPAPSLPAVVAPSITETEIENARAAVALREVEAERGDALAQYEVGLAYLDGAGVPANVDRGIDLIRRAAAQDYIPALMTLPEALANRAADGDPAAAVEALAALDKVIADPPDDRLLGIAHEYYGRYLADVLPPAARDPGAAVDHFVAGLAAGNRVLGRFVGDAYRAGRGRPADPVRALAYYLVAQTLLPDELGPVVFDLESELSPADLERARALTLSDLLALEER
jgi:hypothetical protein